MSRFNTYATDGKCHNAEDGATECGRPATWLGTKSNGWASGFCDHCKEHGSERHAKTWTRILSADDNKALDRAQLLDRAEAAAEEPLTITGIVPHQPALF